MQYVCFPAPKSGGKGLFNKVTTTFLNHSKIETIAWGADAAGVMKHIGQLRRSIFSTVITNLQNGGKIKTVSKGVDQAGIKRHIGQLTKLLERLRNGQVAAGQKFQTKFGKRNHNVSAKLAGEAVHRPMAPTLG